MKTTQYVGVSIDNASAQRIYNYVKQVRTCIEDYVDAFEVSEDARISLIKPSAYHITILRSDQPFNVPDGGNEYMENTTAEHDLLFYHEGYIVLGIMSNEFVMRAMQIGHANEENHNFDDEDQYIAVMKVEGWDEGTWEDVLDFCDKRTILDIDITLGQEFCLETKEQDWELDEDNHID